MSASDELNYYTKVKDHLIEMSPKILEKAPDGLVVVNEQGNICLINERTELIFGYDRSELEGQVVHILMPERLRAVHGEHIVKFFKNPGIREMGSNLDLLGCSKNGEEFTIKVSLSPFTTMLGKFAAAWIRRVI